MGLGKAQEITFDIRTTSGQPQGLPLHFCAPHKTQFNAYTLQHSSIPSFLRFSFLLLNFFVECKKSTTFVAVGGNSEIIFPRNYRQRATHDHGFAQSEVKRATHERGFAQSRVKRATHDRGFEESGVKRAIHDRGFEENSYGEQPTTVN